MLLGNWFTRTMRDNGSMKEWAKRGELLWKGLSSQGWRNRTNTCYHFTNLCGLAICTTNKAVSCKNAFNNIWKQPHFDNSLNHSHVNMNVKGTKLWPAGCLCDWKLSVGNQNFKARHHKAIVFLSDQSLERVLVQCQGILDSFQSIHKINWESRIESLNINWEASRSLIFKAPFLLWCNECGGSRMCPDCDATIHEENLFHDREALIDGSFGTYLRHSRWMRTESWNRLVK